MLRNTKFFLEQKARIERRGTRFNQLTLAKNNWWTVDRLEIINKQVAKQLMSYTKTQ